MAVGTLNVAVTATTRKAQEELKAFRKEVRATGADVKRSSADFGGNTIRDLEKKFAKPPKVELPPLRDAEVWRSKMVDLRGDTDRYSKSIQTQVPLLKDLKRSLGALKTGVTGILAAPVAFTMGVGFGQQLRAFIDDIHSAKDATQQFWSVLGQGESVGARFEREMSQLQQIIDAEGRAATAKATAEREAFKEQEKEIAAMERKLEVMKKGENLVALQEGLKKSREMRNPFFAEGAEKQFEVAERLAAAEAAAKSKKEAAEERRRKIESDAERKAQQRLEQEQAIAELRRDVANFWLSDVEKERSKLLETISDPRLRNEANALFDRRTDQFAEREARKLNKERRVEKAKDRIDALREDRDNIASRSRDQIAALDARTVEGWQALRSSVDKPEIQRLDRLIAIAERQLTAIEKGDEAEAFDPFG
jgi:hypothetical protein